MKPRIAAVLIVAAMLIPFSVCAAQIQATVKADIPFAFVVRDQTLPTGVYQLKPLSPVSPHWVLKGADASVVVGVRLPEDNKLSNPPRLVFDCLGGEYFLTEVHADGDWKVAPSRRQEELARKLARSTREVALR